MICRLVVPVVLTLVLGLATSGQGAVIFSFTYFDVVNDNGRGFDDPVLGAARRAALETTAAQMGARIGQDATIEVGLAPSQIDGMGPVGIASATFNDTTPGIRDGEIYRRIVLGLPDTTPMGLDAGVVFDFGVDMALAGMPAPFQPYFPDIARHELTHALGFGSFLRADGKGFSGTTPDMYTRFDSMLRTDAGMGVGLPIVDSGGNLLLDAGTYTTSYTAGLVFDGPATRAANGGLPLKLFSSSPSHSATGSHVMYVSPAQGFSRDDWTPLDVAVLTDLGYLIVPEPGGAAIVAAVVGGLLLRRSQRRVRAGGPTT
jgi:hypothetical protein